MNEEQARKLAVESVNNISQTGEVVPVADTTIVGIDQDGNYWVTDNGEEVNSLTKEQAIEIIVENLTADEEE